MATGALALSIIGAGSSIIGGIQQRNQANAQASATRAEAQRQANLRQQESESAARKEARSNIEFESRQKLAFLKSGVALEGSPLLLLADTRMRGDENVSSILKTGQTQATSLLQQGTLQSSALKSSGRSALIGGLTKGIGTGFKGFSTFKQSQLTKKKK